MLIICLSELKLFGFAIQQINIQCSCIACAHNCLCYDQSVYLEATLYCRYEGNDNGRFKPKIWGFPVSDFFLLKTMIYKKVISQLEHIFIKH